MKVEFSNLKVIDKAKIDLKPLTILIGPNNAGKTWLAYILSGILSQRGRREYALAYAHDQISRVYPPLDQAIEDVLAKGNATIDLYTFAEQYGEFYFQQVAGYAHNWMDDFMGMRTSYFDSLHVSIELVEDRSTFLRRVEEYVLQRRIAGGLLNIRKKQNDRIAYLFTSTEDGEQITEKLPLEDIREFLVNSITQVLHRSLYPQVRVFPTERTTLVAFRFSSRTRDTSMLAPANENILEVINAIGRGLQQLQGLTGESISTLLARNAWAASGPVGNFLSMMSYVFRQGSRQLEERKKNTDPGVQQYFLLAETLEKEILTGGVNFSTPEPDPRRDIRFQPAEDIALDIPIASSMVKELAPLVFYLRYLAEPGELLIIDEPEMNLHPAAQVKIIEFLAMLVNAGLKVLVTTHSTYVVDHLNNLLDAYKHENQESVAEMFLLESKDAFIAQEKVAVYSVENGVVSNILDQDGKIDWKTFSDVTELIERIHFELLGD